MSTTYSEFEETELFNGVSILLSDQLRSLLKRVAVVLEESDVDYLPEDILYLSANE